MSGTPVRSSAQLFTVAAERVTRLLKSPDHNHFCQAANAVTALYREQESPIARAQHRGGVVAPHCCSLSSLHGVLLCVDGVLHTVCCVL